MVFFIAEFDKEECFFLECVGLCWGFECNGERLLATARRAANKTESRVKEETSRKRII